MQHENKFKKYLDSRKESAYAFSKRVHIHIQTVYRLIRSLPVKNVVAKKVVRSSKGDLCLEDLNVHKTKT